MVHKKGNTKKNERTIQYSEYEGKLIDPTQGRKTSAAVSTPRELQFQFWERPNHTKRGQRNAEKQTDNNDDATASKGSECNGR